MSTHRQGAIWKRTADMTKQELTYLSALYARGYRPESIPRDVFAATRIAKFCWEKFGDGPEIQAEIAAQVRSGAPFAGPAGPAPRKQKAVPA